MSSRHIVAALRILSTACALNPADRRAFNAHLSAAMHDAPEEAPSAVSSAAAVHVAAQPANGLARARAQRGNRRNAAQSAVTGKFVSDEEAAANPKTTISKRRKPRKKKE
jgi:hypothetical protein